MYPGHSGALSTQAANHAASALPRSDLRAWVLPLLMVAVATGCSIFLFPVGFQGYDDLEYLQAAERWLQDGVHAGANHWANRLPYVLAFAAAFKLFGVGAAALVALHALLFAIVAMTVWGLARVAFGRDVRNERAARCSLAVALATPLLFRLPTTFYPEALEVALAGLCVMLVFSQDSKWKEPGRLVLAGILGGLAILVRQTAIALPLVLGPLMLAEAKLPLQTRIHHVAWLAFGFALVQAAELAFYLSITGDPLYRFHTDARHVEIPSVHMSDGAYHGNRILFNWDLASRWQVPSVIELHWSVMPLVRLLTSPGLLLTPWLAIAGGLLAWRAGGAARRFVLLAGLVLLLHYLLNTFVLVIAPNTRYFGVALLLLCPLAGYALAALSKSATMVGFAVLYVVPLLAVAILQPRPASIVDGLENLIPTVPNEVIHLPPDILALAALRLRADSVLAARISPRPALPSELAVGSQHHWPEGGQDARCLDGSITWERIATSEPPSPIWAVIRTVGLSGLIPSRLTPLLMRKADTLYLLRRRC